MPSFDHQSRVALFREHPELAPLLLALPLHLPLPPYDKIELADATFPQHMPTEYHADALILLEDAAGRPQLSIIVEVQTRPDPDKRWVWPFYLTSVFKDQHCPAVLLVLAPDEKTASWASSPIELGPGGSRTVPLVVGPQQVPRIESREEARQYPALAVLSAVTHAPEPHALHVVLAGIEALETGAFGTQSVQFFYDFIRSKMNEAAREALEKLMKIEGYQYQDEFARRYVAEGKAEGKVEGKAEGKVEGKAEGLAEAILRALGKRQLAVSPEQAERIRACRDESLLLTWFDRALTAQTISEVLDS